MARALLKIICSLAFAAVSSPGAAQIVASGAADETSRAGETSRTAWIKTFAAAPIEAQARFEAPDYHGTLIEAAARRLMRDALEARGYRAAGADDGDDILTLSIDVETPAPQGRRPLPKAPIRITSQDRIPGDNIYDPKIDLEFAPPPRKRAGAAREIRVTIYARSGEKRVWSG